MAYEVQDLTPRHHRMMDFYLQGMPVVEIARCLNVTPQNVGTILNSPLAQAELARRRETIKKEIDRGTSQTVVQAKAVLEERSLDAVNRLAELMDTSQNEAIAFRSAKAIMDEALRPKDEGGRVNVVVFQGPKLENLLRAFGKAKERQAVGTQADTHASGSHAFVPPVAGVEEFVDGTVVSSESISYSRNPQ